MPITDIKNIRVFPPLAIARLGSSPEPMDNYDLQLPDDTTGFRKLVPAPSLQVNNGAISGVITPASVQFRDNNNRIKPVSPFLEVWAILEIDGVEDNEFELLTKEHLSDLGLSPSDLSWRTQAGNLKAFRRTGDINDKILADTGAFSNHQSQTLTGQCQNFKAGKSIPFGSVHYIEPNDNFPEIRLRFVPATGGVFGPDANDPNTRDDVYDRSVGGWDDHVDGAPGTPLSTAPGGIYRSDQRGISNAYLDDACDGIIEVSLTVNGSTLTSFCRISSGPPDFAPDSYPLRSVTDELEQMALGPNVTGSVTPSESSEILRRALETVRLMNTDVMNGNQNVGDVPGNRNNMAGQDTGRGTPQDRAFEPLFDPALTDATTVRGFHSAILTQLENNTPPTFLDHLRQYDEVGDLSNEGRRKMPGMMRGSDGNHLALTRRQRDKIRVASTSVPAPTPAPAAQTPEQDMSTLISHFQSRAVLHTGIDNNGKPLSNLFADAGAMMDYLHSARAKGSLSGAQHGHSLVIAGNPDASAFVQLIRRADHPMSGPFSREVPNTGLTGIQIVERWIRSL
ncbi:hypothetical protein MNBD_GAMMA11-3471 [hydrothermal vent metagenome]|uniref:Uncharacterized protein n=1 Tax=hydrothermal vent metagenome TaxID=652676 RepID=A0A3B0XTC4_9ZZZZ